MVRPPMSKADLWAEVMFVKNSIIASILIQMMRVQVNEKEIDHQGKLADKWQHTYYLRCPAFLTYRSLCKIRLS